MSDALEQVLFQGAEARIYRRDFLGQDTIVKERFKKTYRHPTLDHKLTVQRTHQEARSLLKARTLGLACPALYFVDPDAHKLYMEYIPGRTLREYLQDSSITVSQKTAMCEELAALIATLHSGNIIHGDLTTSNFLVRDKGLVVIDFGLAQTSTMVEDKAVDLYVLERAFLSTHPSDSEIFARLLQVYSKKANNGKAVIKKLDAVRLRGRKMSMVG